MQTPITKAIKIINECEKMASFEISTETMRIHLQSLLPYEQKCIEDAVEFGNRQEFYDGSETLGSQYFADNYTNHPIEFDAKKVAISMNNHFYRVLPQYINYKDAAKCVEIALTYSHYTQQQREEIIKCLNDL